MPSLLGAIDDPRLIGGGFKPHSQKQRELCAAIGRSPITVACAGRRFGKSRAAAAGALWNLLLIPELDRMVAPGEKRYAVSVANSQLQARIFLGHALSIVKVSPALSSELEAENEDELIFKGGRILAAFTCSARSGRGWPISYLCLDELAHFSDIEEGGPAVASRIWASMVPSVAQFAELGRVVAISTPLGSDGLFAEIFQKAKSGELPTAEAFHAAAEDNPLIDREFLRGQEAALGSDDYRREYGAEFLAGGASFLEVDRLAEVVADRQELPREAGTDWRAALDPSFAKDATGLAIVGRDPEDRGRLVLGWAGRWLPPRQHRRHRRTREEAAEVTDEILDAVAKVLERYGVREVVTDQHAPGLVVSELAKRGVTVRVKAWTAASRTEILQALRARVMARSIELYDPDGVPLIAELQRLRSRYKAGSSMVEVPRVGDSHGDVALALAAACWEHDRFGFSTGSASVSVPRGEIPNAARYESGLTDVDVEIARVSGQVVTVKTLGVLPRRSPHSAPRTSPPWKG